MRRGPLVISGTRRGWLLPRSRLSSALRPTVQDRSSKSIHCRPAPVSDLTGGFRGPSVRHSGKRQTSPLRMYTPVVEDYLKAIWTLQQTEVPVSTSRIAERLGLTAAAVTAMVKRLAENGLLRHEPYYGVRLTPAGELAGLRIIRRHRVLELFLTEKLGYEWDRVHDEAERGHQKVQCLPRAEREPVRRVVAE